MIPGIAESATTTPLNFIYAKRDLTFLQSVTVASPVYATRDLWLENSSTISEFIGNDPSSPNRVAVGGVMYGAQNANKIGHVNGTATANRLGEVYIVGGCNTKAYDNNATTHACRYGDIVPITQPRIDQIWGAVTGNVIPPGFLEYVPKLTCCSPYPDDRPAGARARRRAEQHGLLVRDRSLGPRSPCETGERPVHLRRRRRAGQPDQQQRHSDRHARDQPDADVDLQLSVDRAGRS